MDQENTEKEQEITTPVSHSRFVAFVVLVGGGFVLYVVAVIFALTR